MPTGILKFDLADPDDNRSFQRATKALEYSLGLWDLSQFLRDKVKYAPETVADGAVDAYQEVRNKLSEIMNEYGLTYPE